MVTTSLKNAVHYPSLDTLEKIQIELDVEMKDFFDFYDLKLIEGELLSEKNAPNDIVIDENTIEKYISCEGSFGNRLKNSVDFDKGGSVVKRFSSEKPREAQNIEKIMVIPPFNKIL